MLGSRPRTQPDPRRPHVDLRRRGRNRPGPRRFAPRSVRVLRTECLHLV